MLFRGLIRQGGHRDLALVRWWMDCSGFGGKLLGVVTVVRDLKMNVARSSRLASDKTLSNTELGMIEQSAVVLYHASFKTI